MDIKIRLKIMFFLQFFVWGSWLITLGSYMFETLHFSGASVGLVYSTLGLAAIFMPSLMGIVADKWVNANYLYIVCHAICAVALFFSAVATTDTTLYWLMLINALAYSTTLALSNTIAYHSLEKYKLEIFEHFPGIRVYGTVGFIIAMWAVSLFRFELSHIQLYFASIASLILAVFSFLLPNIPTNKNEVTSEERSWISALGLDAFVLFKDKQIAVFLFFSILLGAILQVTNTFGNPFLHDFATVERFKDSFVVKYPSILLSISQISEVFFILAIPFFFKRFGIKNVLLISMIAWALRFGLFAIGDPSALGVIFLLLSMIVYGCAFDFFNISGSMYIEAQAPSRIRASAQGLFMMMVNGIGAYLGSIISGRIVDAYTIDGIKNWPKIWLVFTIYSLVLAVLFYFFFNEKKNKTQSA